MNFMQRWKRFWTLERKSNSGFTLVELVVVIAILAILAGVGSAAYSGYIKSANKGKDKTLVGNVMRAIETGTNSSMFVNDDSFKMGSLSYPIGFVVLTTEGTEVIVSRTSQKNADMSSCDFRTITITYASSTEQEYTCPTIKNSKRMPVYELATQNITCCLSHSEFIDTTNDVNTSFATDYTHTCRVEESCVGTTCLDYNKFTATSTLTVPAGTQYFVEDMSLLYEESSIDGLCQFGYANQYGIYETPQIDDAVAGNSLYDSLEAAFGSNFTADLKLSYDKWTSEEGLGYASFYTGATELMNSLNSMAGTLAAVAWNESLANKLGLTKTYKNTDEILTGVSNNLVVSYSTVDAMLEAWNNDDSMTWDSYGFNVTGRENYSAMRAAYNNAFASYLDACGANAYAEGIRNYSKTVAGYSVALPLLVCSDAFTDKESGLQGQLNCTDDEFEQIAQLYQEYIESGACNENGRLVYDVLKTVDSTSDVAYAYKDLNGSSVFNYYNSYVNEMSSLYSEAQSRAGDGIIIIVTVNEGQLHFNVSPDSANPRND